jgi:hypothetical protein
MNIIRELKPKYRVLFNNDFIGHFMDATTIKSFLLNLQKKDKNVQILEIWQLDKSIAQKVELKYLTD